MDMKASERRNRTSDNPTRSVRLACTAIGVAAWMALSAAPAMAQVDGATQVTDPATLKALGFSPSAQNVYVSNALVRAQQSQQAQQAQQARTDEWTVAPQLTPTSGTDYSAISAKEFAGRVDSTGTQWTYTSGTSFDLSRAGTELFADARFQVPTGATLDFFRYWAYDNNAADLAFFVFRVCQPAFAGGAQTYTTIVSTSTSGAPGNTSGLVSLNELVDNQACVYQARVRFDAAASSLALQKVRLQFTR
jgi:hypothetical protein